MSWKASEESLILVPILDFSNYSMYQLKKTFILSDIIGIWKSILKLCNCFSKLYYGSFTIFPWIWYLKLLWRPKTATVRYNCRFLNLNYIIWGTRLEPKLERWSQKFIAWMNDFNEKLCTVNILHVWKKQNFSCERFLERVSIYLRLREENYTRSKKFGSGACIVILRSTPT